MTITLYVKQHSITKLKYFGKTTRDVDNYLGSGLYWKRHIKEHGKNYVVTLETYQFANEKECTEFALEYSRKNNIVESPEWANLIPETGLDGGSPMKNKKQSDYQKKKVSEVQRGRIRTPESIAKFQKSFSLKMHSEDYVHPLTGIPKDPLSIEKMKMNMPDFTGQNNPMFGKKHKQTSIEIQSNKAKNRKKELCPHCHKTLDVSNLKRWHGNNCKMKNV